MYRGGTLSRAVRRDAENGVPLRRIIWRETFTLPRIVVEELECGHLHVNDRQKSDRLRRRRRCVTCAADRVVADVESFNAVYRQICHELCLALCHHLDGKVTRDRTGIS